jgi:hypothetical protein
MMHEAQSTHCRRTLYRGSLEYGCNLVLGHSHFGSHELCFSFRRHGGDGWDRILFVESNLV